MGKNNQQNNQQNNQSKKQKSQKPIQETLHEQAAIRLKTFIEDLKHDPMFRHRLFYPVLYKEITRSSQYANKNGVNASVAEVIYEYYLLKMEKFDNDKTAQIFQAILLSNGPLLPKQDRLRISDSGDADSLLNPKNKKEILHRTKVLLTVLQDENLYNFIFRSTVGGNLDSMRNNFKKLVKNINISTGGYKIQDEQIKRSVEIDWSRLKKGKNPVITPLEKNVQHLSEYFEHIRDKDISDTVNFLIYMGKSRNIVTDFSYRPMTQEQLDQFSDYGISEQDESLLEFRNQLEQALDANVLQKDLTSQMDTFIPLLAREYGAICTGDSNTLDWKSSQKLSDYSIKNALKNKMQRSLKQIGDYTRNYLTKELLSTNPEKPQNDKFISRVIKEFYKGFGNNESVADLSRNNITYENFIGSNKTDLEELIKQIFKNDISYILEICSKDDENLKKRKESFQAAWDLSQMSNEKKVLNKIQTKIISMLNDSLKCMNESNRSIDDVEKNLQKLINKSGESINIDKIRADIISKLNTILSKSDGYNNDTVAERVAETALKEISKLFSNLMKAVMRKSDMWKFANTVIFYTTSIEFIRTHLNSYIDILKTATSYEDIINSLKGIFVISKIGEEVIKTDVNGKSVISYDQQAYKYITEKFLSHAKKCFGLSNAVADILKKVPTDAPAVDEMLKDLSVAQKAINKVAGKVNVEPLADRLTQIYFKYYLKPVLINFFGYAFDEFEFASRRNDIESDIISKDVLHFSTLLTPSNVGVLTFDGAVIQDLAKFTYILMTDTFSGISYSSPDSVIKFLNEVYGIKYFNIVIYGQNDAYVYLNNIGVPYLYRGAKTKIPIGELRKNYDFLMDSSRGLYKNISLPKKKH